MKYAALPLVCAIFLLGSCKESGPAIDFGPSAKDTAFTSAPEAVQPRVVVLEEFTGVTCSNCPAGHELIKTLEDANPNRIAAVGIQIFNFVQCNPVHEGTITTQHDNRTQVGTDIANNIYGGVGAMPQAGIDRTISNSSMLYTKGNWASLVNNRLAISPAANVTVSSIFNASSRQAIIKVHIAYTSIVAKRQLLTVAMVENNVIDAQESGTDFMQDYSHQHVLRGVLTAPQGDAILSNIAAKQPGQVYERTFIYTVDAGWNPDNCQVVAYVSNDNGADKEVVQGAETHLK